MHHIMVPILLLMAAVALSTEVELPHLTPLKPGPDSVSDQSNSDSNNPLSQCEILRRLFHSKANWMFNTENNQEDYNENFNKRQGTNVYDYDSIDDEWLSYPKQSYQPKIYGKKYYYERNANDDPQKWVQDTPSLSPIKTLYLQNKDVLIRDDRTYYIYDTYMTTTSPFDYIYNQHNCLYKAKLQPLLKLWDDYYNALPADANTLELQEDRERLDTNEITPVTETIVAKRYESEEIGEKELPDNLVVSDADTGEVQKKLFSFWSRLQALSHKGRQLPTRRHTFVFYGPDGTRDGPLTAETRASHLRPPGQPLRWG